MYTQYDGLIFDMDGTILDTELAHCKAWQEVLAHYGMTFDREVIATLDGAPSWEAAQALINQQDADLDPYQLARQKNNLVKIFLLDTVQPLPLVDVVKEWHGQRPMSVGTGCESEIADMLLTHLGLRQYFVAIVAAEHVKHHKPAPDTFLLCAKRMGVIAEKCIVFENADFGIQAAQAAGMDVIDVRLLTI